MENNTNITSFTWIGQRKHQLNDEWAVHLANALKTNKTLEYLDLRGNDIRDEGAKKLAEALKENNTLKSLSLEDNYITYIGVIALAEMLKVNTSLETISLHGNYKIGKVDIKKTEKVSGVENKDDEHKISEDDDEEK